MKLLNLALLLTTLTLSTACEFISTDSSGSSNAGEKKLETLAENVEHFEDECPNLEGQYLVVWERDEYGMPMEYTTIYAKNQISATGEMILVVDDGVEVLVNGKPNSTRIEGNAIKYIASCSNGVLKLSAAAGRDFITTTYETAGTTLFYKSKGNGPDGSFEEDFQAELDNNFRD